MNGNDSARLSEQLDSLRDAVTQLAESIKSSEVMVQESRSAAAAAEKAAAAAKRSTGYQRWALAGLAAVLATQSIFFFRDRDQNADIGDLRAVQSELNDVQARTNNQVLCPLYKIFIDSIRANPAPVSQAPAAQEFRQRALVTIEDSYYEKLRCEPR